MALYEGLKNSGSLLDDMLGKGSQATVQAALGIKVPPRVTVKPRWSTAKVEAIGSGARTVPRGKKGVGRALIAVVLLGFGLQRLHPWTRGNTETPVLRRAVAAETPKSSWAEDLGQLLRPGTEAERAKQEAVRALAEQQEQAKEAAQLAALPVDPAGGTALALWQDGSGRWWQVNGKGELRPCSGPAGKDSLGLPELRGVSARAEEHGQGKRLSLNLPAGLLKTLLPLEPSVASEVRALLLDEPAQPALLTHDNTRCLLDLNDWERRQKRLGLVLADLAAKKRRATLIDLRYEDTAVVRPAGRG